MSTRYEKSRIDNILVRALTILKVSEDGLRWVKNGGPEVLGRVHNLKYPSEL